METVWEGLCVLALDMWLVCVADMLMETVGP